MKLYGLIGRHLGHSWSKSFFSEFWQSQSIEADYHNFEIESIDQLPGLVAMLPELQGFNVTIPYKIEVLKYLDWISPKARRAGAVNTVAVERVDGKVRLSGYNTDAAGFAEALKPHLRPDIKSALVLGTGGASRAVEVALDDLGISHRSVSRSAGRGVLTYDELSAALIAENRLIVNCTPLGMWPNIASRPDIPYDSLTSRHVCFDLVYNPETTEFMRTAALHGAKTVGGLAMLHAQALAAWAIWTARR